MKSKFVTGKRGMIGAANSLVASTGLSVLRNGGNAMDSAIAMALTSNVVLPDMCGIGGDAFFLYYEAKTKKVHALNGSGFVGENYNKDYYTSRSLDTIPEHGIHSISVSGAISTYFNGLEKFGSKSFFELASDAIYYCEHGFELSERTRNYVIRKKALIDQSLPLKNMFYDNEVLKPIGSKIYNKALAESLKVIAEEGASGFYNSLANRFVPNLNKLGADFKMSDFKNYESEWVNPISVQYKNHTIFELPPVSQGIIHLEMHNILDNVCLNDYGLNSAEAIHTMVEAKKLAFKDRINLFGDPNFQDNPIERVLDPLYGRQLYESINQDTTLNVDVDMMNRKSKDTTSFVVVDEEGNACSFITSVSDAFGACIMDEETGIIFNNRLGTNFNLEENNPNFIEPFKKSMNTLVTYIVTNNENDLVYLGNTPGGDRQPQWNAQVIINLLDFKLNLQEVLNQPFWYDNQAGNPYNKKVENILFIENTIDQNTVEVLQSKGHKVELINKCNCINQLIMVNEEGVYFGVEDWRSDGVTIGY